MLATILMDFCSLAAEDKSRLSLANESQYLLISRDSVTALHEKILKRREEGDTQDCFGKYSYDKISSCVRVSLQVFSPLPVYRRGL
jgi:hypothetical protein